MHLLIGVLLVSAFLGLLCLRNRRVRRAVQQLLLLRRSMRREFQRLSAGHGVEPLMERRAKKVSLES